MNECESFEKNKFQSGRAADIPPSLFFGNLFSPTDIRPTHMQQIKKEFVLRACRELDWIARSLFFFNFRSKERCGNKRIVLLWRFSLVFENHAPYSQLKATKYNWSCKSWWEGILPESSSSIVLKRRTIESRSW